MGETKKFGPVEIQQIFEQADASLEGSATLLASYYSALIGKGIPPELASLLVRDFHSMVILGNFKK